MHLRVKLLNENAKLPTLGHEGDLGYDIYASETMQLFPGAVYKVPTGIAVQVHSVFKNSLGLIIKDRSSMAARGIFTHGGVIDSGYRGEIVVLMTTQAPQAVFKGDKIAQLVPVPVLTDAHIEEIEYFEEPTTRGAAGFGSTGK